MIRRHLAILGLAGIMTGIITGCDDADISGLERRTFLKAGALVELQEASGLLVEIHGGPWPGATPEEIASTLRMPEGPAHKVRFRVIPPGQWVLGDAERVVLTFNPAGPVSRAADCRATEEIATKPPSRQGFTVNATFCKGSEWQKI